MRAQGILISILVLLLVSGCEHPWFESGKGAPETQQPALVAPPGYSEEHPPERPPWVPLIDQCIAEGGTRGECIESLPPKVLEALERQERENAARRRLLMNGRNEPRFGLAN